MSANRDDFSIATKRAIALRASHRCSIPECGRPTAGPSEESPATVALVGEAAHIHAAASGPGSRRYLASMTSEERIDISNAIWLCPTHARLIDRDEAKYTPEILRRIKAEHERRCARELEIPAPIGRGHGGLIAVGPDVTFIGDLVGSASNEWILSVRHFVEGDVYALMRFVEDFEAKPQHLRYVLANAIGDGRVLATAPTWAWEGPDCIIRCRVLPSTERVRADQLGADLLLSDRHDLMVRNGDLAMVSGLEALPQKLEMTLSLRSGELAFEPDWGTRLAEYYALLQSSRWFDDLVRLEVIRQAAIPIGEGDGHSATTPLQCVERVFEVRVICEAVHGWLPISVGLDIKGVGRWDRELQINVVSGYPKRRS